MPIVRVNNAGRALELHGQGGAALPELARMARAGEGPVIVMVHGFSFRPGHGRHCPHAHILAMEDGPNWKAVSWPRGLGFGAGDPGEGLGLAFGWDARGTIRGAWRRAALAGRALARAMRAIGEAAPGREVHAIGHSLGARVILQALSHLEPGAVGRAILLNPAEFRAAAEAALARGAGPGAEVIAVTGRENAGFDLMLERLVAPARPGDRVLGRAPLAGPGRATLWLDRPEVVARLTALGYPLAPGPRGLCHWSPYLRGGALTLHAGLMRQAGALPLAALHLPDRAPVTWRRAGPPLPMGRNAPS